MSVVGEEDGKRKRSFGEKCEDEAGDEMRNAELVWKRNGRGFVRRQGN